MVGVWRWFYFLSMVLKNPQLSIDDKVFNWGSRTYIMGILNVTPDSFSGDGLLSSGQNEDSANKLKITDIVESTIIKARSFISAGADILDIGGESTRPGSQQVGVEDELSKVIPIIEAISAEMDVVISIDTYKAAVAEAALKAGAHIINDVWGLNADENMAGIAAKYNAPVILMHNRSSWAHAEIKSKLGGRYIGMEYYNLIEDIKTELSLSISTAVGAGIPGKHIIIDPGIGFGKTVEQNFELVNRLDEFRSLGYPVLFGPSRKSFIGYTLDLPTDQRVEGTAAAIAIGIDRGADIIRVHDVEYMARVARISDAVVRQTVQ